MGGSKSPSRFPLSKQTRRPAATNSAADKVRRILSSEVNRARRGGYWFRLPRTDRTFFGLALKLNIRLEGRALLRALMSVLKRLKGLGDELYLGLQWGTKLAWAYSTAAVRWGNPSAQGWRNDRSYILFLGKVFPRRTLP